MVKDVLIWLYWHPFKLLIYKIPFRYSFLLAGFFGKIIYCCSFKKRCLLEIELLGIFGKTMKRSDTKRIMQNTFIMFFHNEFEMLFFPKLTSENISSFVTYTGIEHLDKALSAGRGVMLLFAHFGANQMIMPAIGYHGYKMSQISAPATVWKEKLPNKRFSRMETLGLEMRWKHELSLPVTHINVFGSLKEAFLCLKRNEILGIAIDGGGVKDSVIVDFLGRKALFSTGAMKIALRTGCAVLPTFMIRGRDGRNKMIIEAPLEIKYKEQDEGVIKENLLVFVKRLEEYILRYPCHYLNFLVLRSFMSNVDGIPFIIKKEEVYV